MEAKGKAKQRFPSVVKVFDPWKDQWEGVSRDFFINMYSVDARWNITFFTADTARKQGPRTQRLVH